MSMFVAYCPGHGSKVLLFAEHIEELHNDPSGVHLRWRCTCGTAGTTVIPRSPAPAVEAA